MHLKPSLVLSLVLLLGVPPVTAQAKPPRRTPSSSARKSSASKKKTKTPPAEKTAPAPDPAPAPAPDPAPAPTEATAPSKAPPPEAAPAHTSPAPAEPTSTSRVAVLAIPVDRNAAEDALRVEADLRSALGTLSDVQLVDMAALFPPPAPASLKEGDTLFEEGRSLYDNLDPEAAAKKFAEATAFYLRHPVETAPERLGRAYIFLGASLLLNGDNAGAQDAFTRALLAAPSIQPESKLFGQDVQSAFLAAKESFAKQPRGTLSIDSLPPGAQVKLHGEPMGTTPLKEVELAAGKHQVVLTSPGYAPAGTFQEIVPSKRNELRPSLEPTPGLAAVLDSAAKASTPKALGSDKLPPEADTLSERLGARYVVLAAVKKDRRGRVEAELHAWDTQTKSRLRGVELKPADARSHQKAVDQLHSFLTGKLVPRAASPIVLPEVVKKPWFWAAVGGAAVAATAGVVLATQNGPSSPLGNRLGLPGGGW